MFFTCHQRTAAKVELRQSLTDAWSLQKDVLALCKGRHNYSNISTGLGVRFHCLHIVVCFLTLTSFVCPLDVAGGVVNVQAKKPI